MGSLMLSSCVDEYYVLDVDEVIYETEKALKVVLEPEDPTNAYLTEEELWIPKSQILDSSEVMELGDAGSLHVTMWLAKEKGWF